MSAQNDEPETITDVHGRVWKTDNRTYRDGKSRYQLSSKLYSPTAEEIRSLALGSDFRH